MTAVINNDINILYLLPEVSPKITVALVSDENLGPFVFVGPALRPQIDPVNKRLRSKVRFPHGETAAAKDSYLNYSDFLSHKLLKMTMINLEIMLPLPNASAVGHRLEICSQWIWSIAVT